MGYREAFDVLAGRRDVEQAALTDVRRTWAYARRQGTWFRSEPDITWLAEGEGLVARAMAVLTPFLQDAVPERGIVAVIGPDQLG